MSEKYNGWTNYETWVWKLQIDNDQGWQEYLLARAAEVYADAEPEFDFMTKRDQAIVDLAAELESEADDMQEQTVTFTGPLADILGSALCRIDWHEIAESLIDDAEEIAA